MAPADDQFADHHGIVPPEELQRASDRFEKRQKALARTEGPGATEAAQAITRKYIAAFTDDLRRVLSARSTQSVHRELLAVIRGLDAEVLALCILHGAQHSIGQRENYRDAALRIGKFKNPAADSLLPSIRQRARDEGRGSLFEGAACGSN